MVFFTGFSCKGEQQNLAALYREFRIAVVILLDDFAPGAEKSCVWVTHSAEQTEFLA
jgi:hypothetical protein